MAKHVIYEPQPAQVACYPLRVEAGLWLAVRAKADAEQRTLRAVLLRLLRAYVNPAADALLLQDAARLLMALYEGDPDPEAFSHVKDWIRSYRQAHAADTADTTPVAER